MVSTALRPVRLQNASIDQPADGRLAVVVAAMIDTWAAESAALEALRGRCVPGPDDTLPAIGRPVNKARAAS